MRSLLLVCVLLCGVQCQAAKAGPVLTFKAATDEPVSAEQWSETAETLGERLDAAGIDADVSVAEGAIRVEIQGDASPERVNELATGSGELCFYVAAGESEAIAVLKAVDARFPDRFLSHLKRGEGSLAVAAEDVDAIQEVLDAVGQEPGVIPADKKVWLQKAEADGSRRVHVTEAKPALCARVHSAGSTADPHSPGHWKVQFGFKPEEGERFGDLTEASIGRGLAIVVGDRLFGVPIVRSRVGSSGEITGSFTEQEARDLAAALNSGPLPVALVRTQEGE